MSYITDCFISLFPVLHFSFFFRRSIFSRNWLRTSKFDENTDVFVFYVLGGDLSFSFPDLRGRDNTKRLFYHLGLSDFRHFRANHLKECLVYNYRWSISRWTGTYCVRRWTQSGLLQNINSGARCTDVSPSQKARSCNDPEGSIKNVPPGDAGLP